MRLKLFDKWILAGLLLLVAKFALLLLSPGFDYEIPLADRPVLELVGLLFFSGVVYFWQPAH